MAYSTRRPGGGWSTVSTRSDYSNVVSNYAAVIKQAQESQKSTELESKVYSYKNGLLSYDDLKKYLDSRLTVELPGSQMELNIRQLGTELDSFENKKNKDIQRSKLEAQYSSNGISAAERVAIENSLMQYYKEGTPEYTEQLTTIAAAKELQRVEDKNAKIARIESQLSDGGMTTDEQISLYQQAQSLTEKGSQEYSEISTKINGLKTQQKEEQNSQRLMQLQSDLLDKYASGGLTDDEKLIINKEMQKVVQPGTQDYIDLKENEAELLEAKSKGGASDVDKANLREAEIQFQKSQALLSAAEQKFEMGSVTPEEYFAEKEDLLNRQSGILEGIGDAASPNDIGNMQAELQNFIELKNKVQTGEAVTIKDGNGKFGIVPLKELSSYSSLEEVASLGELDSEGNAITSKKRAVVTVLENGVEKRYAITDDGKFEPLSEKQTSSIDGKTGVSVASGQKLDKPSSGSKSLTTTPQEKKLFSASSDEVISNTPISSEAGSVKGASTSRSSSSKRSDPSSSKSSSSSSSSGVKINLNPTSLAKTAQAAIKVASAPLTKEFGQPQAGKVKAGNIPGTLDFGITEKLGIGNALKKATSFVSNLFKKK